MQKNNKSSCEVTDNSSAATDSHFLQCKVVVKYLFPEFWINKHFVMFESGQDGTSVTSYGKSFRLGNGLLYHYTEILLVLD